MHIIISKEFLLYFISIPFSVFGFIFLVCRGCLSLIFPLGVHVIIVVAHGRPPWFPPLSPVILVDGLIVNLHPVGPGCDALRGLLGDVCDGELPGGG